MIWVFFAIFKKKSSYEDPCFLFWVPCLLGLLVMGCRPSSNEDTEPDAYRTWSSYLGDPGRSHYSTLSQIHKGNLKDLKVAWRYEAPDWGQMQMNPLVVDSLLYGVTAALRVIALDARTGREVWQFGDSVKVWHSTSRGVSYWKKGEDQRILVTRGPHLFALNALTGAPIPSFGDGGKIDMRSGMPPDAIDKFVISNTPGSIFEDLIIMPLRLSEDVGAAPGDVMAFNVVTGELAWVFHTIPHPGEPGHDTWEDPMAYKNERLGAANNWAGMAVDETRGIIYIPTGSAAPDFYGKDRKGSNLYANCLLALNARTGEKIWHFQFTHHDLWDRDPPAPPNLITVQREGKDIPAVAQVTKQGYVFVFDRRTGDPLFEIEERPVPASTLTGETAWPTQPIPVAPKPFARQSQHLTAQDISPFATNRDSLIAFFNKADKRQYAPPSLSPTLLLPGYDGAAEWGGAATDPDDGMLYVNSNEMAWKLQMGIDAGKTDNSPLGAASYRKYCSSCHQENRKGLVQSGFPALTDLALRKDKNEVAQIIAQGKGMMTGFPQIKGIEQQALLSFLFDEEIQHSVASKGVMDADSAEVGYKHLGYHKFLDSKGLPALAPPWGTLHAINLNTGEYRWSVPLGDTPFWERTEKERERRIMADPL